MPFSRSSVEAERTIRNGLAANEQEALLRATVAIIGCGGLGGRTAELLLRLGVGSFILTDPDIFEHSNLNRQIFCTPETIGQEKAAVVSHELQRINPNAHITFYVQTFTSTSIEKADIVIDGLDSAADRLQLAKMCRKRKIPLIHGTVQQWYGLAGVDHTQSPLLDTLYANTNTAHTPEVLPMTVALIAAMQAAEACKCILQHNSPLQNSWLQCDLRNCEYEQIALEKS